MTRPCRKCGALITFLPGPAGKAIPAQKARSVYRRAESGALEKLELEGGPFWISHFETCPGASQFSRRNR